MGIYLYDEALLDKFKSWTEKTNIYVMGTDETSRTFEMIAEKTNDKPIKLPLICLRRNGGYQLNTLSNVNKTVMTYDGLTIEADVDKSVVLNAIPVTIQYQIDIYTKYKKEADLYAREIIFNMINHPTVQITIPYNGLNYIHNFNMKLAQDIQDNSDIPERLFTGEFARYTISFEVDDAYLWDVRVRSNVTIGGNGLAIHSSSSDVILEEID